MKTEENNEPKGVNTLKKIENLEVGNKKYKINLVSCHRKPERSFFWKGKQFPVCARCTGIYSGYITYPIFLLSYIELGWLLTIAIILPTYLDGLLQGFTKYRSNNILRVVTGFMAGAGAMSILSLIGKPIGKYILTFYN